MAKGQGKNGGYGILYLVGSVGSRDRSERHRNGTDDGVVANFVWGKNAGNQKVLGKSLGVQEPNRGHYFEKCFGFGDRHMNWEELQVGRSLQWYQLWSQGYLLRRGLQDQQSLNYGKRQGSLEQGKRQRSLKQGKIQFKGFLRKFLG
ncbi:unnamed protein product [Allacma fusca]|uniref:Uncharacterized protein n=1 Tax=Allacma fusca TaxID=39272 RepID=A0A8J2KGF7_9HEXA|nr:unnamed protein product [Allacma fusca]